MKKISILFSESWNVAWRKKGTGSLLHDKKSIFHVIRNPIRYWAADPFLFESKGKHYIFAELYDYVKRRGTIGYYSFDQKKWISVIKEDYHLSYPYIFKRGNDIYLLPEAKGSSSLYMYRAVDFPDKWEKTKKLRNNVRYVDTTLFFGDAIEYALTYEIEDYEKPSLMILDIHNQANDREICLDEEKVKRPAGKFFLLKSVLYRPAQNCKEGYGKGLIFYKCDFSDNKYGETQLKEIKINELNLSKKMILDGMHTYNSDSEYEVIDIKTKRFNIIDFIFRLIKKMTG